MADNLLVLYLFESPIPERLTSKTLGFGEMRVCAALSDVSSVVGIGRKGKEFYALSDDSASIEKKIRLIRYDWPGQLLFYYLNFLPQLWWGYQYCSHHHVDLIHAESPHISGIAAILLGRRFGIKTAIEYKVSYEAVALSRYGSFLGHIFSLGFRVLTQWVTHRADLILANCTLAENTFKATYADIKNSGHYNAGIQIPKHLSNPTQSTNFSVGFLGRLYPDKGVLYLLKAILLHAQWFRTHAVHFCIGGDGPDRVSAEHFIRTHHLNDLVNMEGTVDRFMFLERMKLMVNTTIVKPALEMAIAESQAMGIPVIAFGESGFPETVKHEYSGLIVPIGDTTMLSIAIQRLVEDATLYKQMAVNAVKHARAYGFDRQVESLRHAYACIFLTMSR